MVRKKSLESLECRQFDLSAEKGTQKMLGGKSWAINSSLLATSGFNITTNISLTRLKTHIFSVFGELDTFFLQYMSCGLPKSFELNSEFVEYYTLRLLE